MLLFTSSPLHLFDTGNCRSDYSVFTGLVFVVCCDQDQCARRCCIRAKESHQSVTISLFDLKSDRKMTDNSNQQILNMSSVISQGQ